MASVNKIGFLVYVDPCAWPHVDGRKGSMVVNGSLDPATVETRMDPVFNSTDKALLGQQLQLKGHTVTTKVSDLLPEQPRKFERSPV